MARAVISIVGLGLVGASLGLAIRKAKPEIEVLGHDLNANAAKQALKLGAIEKSEWNLINACEKANLLVLATPAMAIKEIFQLTAPYLPEGQVITDTAGSKAQVMQWADELLPAHVAFVGGDPMVGANGNDFTPHADLFQGTTYCLSSGTATPNNAIQLVVGLVELVGATPYFVDPSEHDSFVAMTDHLSFMVSTAMLRMAVAQGEPSRIPADIHHLIGATFRRATGFSSDDPQTFRDLCLTNRDAIARRLDEMSASLADLGAVVREGDSQKLDALFNGIYVTRQVASRPYHDPDQEAQSAAIRMPGAFGIGDLLGIHPRKAPDKGKEANGRRK
ncbi:MAG: prephenate dehydrogenase/arogenate dehydrogenase family protein [Chloroflexi bacterium]|nr:prephenate dehydrogenase/arogenate dehydrogenase family protein [Chloroflexota bacterium]